MAIHEILQLGHPKLRVKCAPVKLFASKELRRLIRDLGDTLYDFKAKNGFGRGIAAPQIGVTQRVIFIHADKPMVLANPAIVERSRKLITLWDDCFSLPNLLVKVKRNAWIVVRYRDESGARQRLKARGAVSELLQHEIDHLNGILAIDRAIDSRHIVFRSEYQKWKKSARAVDMRA